MREGRWAVAVHGGCKDIRPDQVEANRRGIQSALTVAVRGLRAGGSALDAVEAAVRVLEDDPVFNAGRGSVERADGSVEMDAAIMDGATLDIGALCGLRRVENPVSAARGLLRAPETLVSRHEGAAGTPTAKQSGYDTVGAVAWDTDGHLAAAVSTGGLTGARPGRVGDSPLPGCGFYADDRVGAVSGTGEGESISRMLLAARVVFSLEQGADPQAAVDAALARLDRVGGVAGLVALDRRGRVGWGHNGDQFAVGWASGPSPELTVRITGLETADE